MVKKSKKSAKKPPEKKAEAKEPSSGVSFGQRLRSIFSFSKKRGDGTLNDELFFDMLDAGLLEDGNEGDPQLPQAKADEAEGVIDLGEAANLQWPEARLKIVQDIWGKDFLKPGGAEHVIELIRPLALNADHTVLDIGAGLGGSSRTIASETDAWVTGYESNGDLAQAAMEISKMAGMTRKAPISELPPGGLNLKANSVHAVFSKEALYKIEDKSALFATLNDALRPHGQIMLTDYVAAAENIETPELQAWFAHERTSPHLWTTEGYRQHFTENGYDVRVAEDITDKYYSIVVSGFSTFSNKIKSFRGDREMEAWSVREAEFWVHRMAPFEKGDLRVCRVFAQKGG